MNSGRPISRILAHSTIGTAVTRGLGALGGVAIARLLGPAARGDVAILMVVASIASLVGAAGLQFWIARDVAQQGHLPARTIAVVAWHSAVVLIGGAVLGLVSGVFIVPTLVSAGTWAMTVAFATTGAVAFGWLALPNGARAMGVVSIATATASAVYLGGALVLLALDRHSVATIMGLAALGNVLTIVVCAIYTARHRDRIAVPRSEIGLAWRNGLRFGAAGGVGELVLFGMLRVDFLLVALFLPPAAVGVYAVATALTELLWVIPDGTAQIALPSAATADADALPAVFRLSLTATAVAGVFLSLVAAPVLRILFGSAYAPGARTVPFLAAAAVAGGAWKMLSADLAARHSTRDRFTSATVGLMMMVAADLVLIPAFGLTGAAAGAALGYVAATVIVLRVWCATTGRPASALFGIRAGDLDAIRNRPPVAMTAGGVR